MSIKEAPVGSGEADRSGIDSISVAETVKVKRTFSVVLRGPMVAKIGSLFPASVTVMATSSMSVARESSVAVKVTLYSPD